MIGVFKTAVNTKLNANATIAAHGVYFAEVPRSENPNKTGGYVRWTATFGDTQPIHGDDIEISDITVSIFSKSLASVSTLHKEVMTQLDDADLAITGYSCIHTQRMGGHLPPEREHDTRLWHQAVLYEVTYE